MLKHISPVTASRSLSEHARTVSVQNKYADPKDSQTFYTRDM